MRRLFLCIGILFALAACGHDDRSWVTADAAARDAYVSNEPPSITVFTTMSDQSHGGVHSGLLINASQRVLFDPAGSFSAPSVAIRQDIVYGVTPAVLSAYMNFHSTEGFHLVAEKFAVSPEAAEAALHAAEKHGAAAKGLCTTSVGEVLRQVPGFEKVSIRFLPERLMSELETYPGVTKTIYHNGVPETATQP